MKGILIGGGVGPMAGVELHKKIISNTKTSGTDQDHLDVIHLSFSSLLDDRTKFLLNNYEINPGEIMADLVIAASEIHKKNGHSSVSGVPCNTFHAEKIFSAYTNKICKSGKDIKIVNMIEETVLYLQSQFKKGSKIGLLSTTGTRKTFLYSDYLEKAGFKLVQVDENEQDDVHDIIYNKNWGIKAKSPVTNIAIDSLELYLSQLKDKGANCIILGCTEFPLALPSDAYKGIPLVDPVSILARALIREADSDKLK
jgi:aspartate racemase